MMLNDFTTGDVVILQAGSPLLTIETIEGDRAKCIWFDQAILQSSSFPTVTLLKVPASDPASNFRLTAIRTATASRLYLVARDDSRETFGRQGGDDGRGNPQGQNEARRREALGRNSGLDPNGRPLGERSFAHLMPEDMRRGFKAEGHLEMRANPDGSLDIWVDRITIGGQLVGVRGIQGNSVGSGLGNHSGRNGGGGGHSDWEDLNHSQRKIRGNYRDYFAPLAGLNYEQTSERRAHTGLFIPSSKGRPHGTSRSAKPYPIPRMSVSRDPHVAQDQ
jgi:uncharacterized protein YodC (DUF2158 family)